MIVPDGLSQVGVRASGIISCLPGQAASFEIRRGTGPECAVYAVADVEAQAPSWWPSPGTPVATTTARDTTRCPPGHTELASRNMYDTAMSASDRSGARTSASRSAQILIPGSAPTTSPGR